MLRGARQVGKTTLVHSFAKEYSNYIYLNLEKKDDKYLFEEKDNVKEILEFLLLKNNIPEDSRNNTLLFIDEIQESEKAISLLRYFYEDLPGLHLIAAGSLLEQIISRIKNFPVGRIEYLYLHPMNFSEFLVVKGKKQLASKLQQIPADKIAHQLLLNEFHEYAILGGMPEVLVHFIEKNSIAELSTIYSSIWETYKNDVEKYSNNSSEARIIKYIISNAHLYLDQRIKFEGFANSNYKSREVGEAFRNLDDAKIIQLLYPTTDKETPLKPDIKKSPRMQFLDTGLINNELKIQADLLMMKDLSNAYKGSLIPHLIYQELLSLNERQYYKPFFWVRDKKQSSAELDLLIQINGKVVPVEIKSGKTGTLKSLHQFIDTSESSHAIRIYGGEFSIEDHITPIGKKKYKLMNLPYYIGTQLYDYANYLLKVD